MYFSRYLANTDIADIEETDNDTDMAIRQYWYQVCRYQYFHIGNGQMYPLTDKLPL